MNKLSMMRYATKIPPFNSITKFEFYHCSLFNFSTFSKRKTPSKPHNTDKPRAKKQTALEKEDNRSLFSEITEILGTGNLAFDKIPSWYSVSDASFLGLDSTIKCTPDVCENDKEKDERESEEFCVRRDTQIENFAGHDDSKIVHKITQIVRADSTGISMEERLDNSSCEISSDVVCKVLKRCFKVPHLATRFFNWVRLRNGGCLTTESYNTMLYLVGEAKEFELVESLVEEMGNHKCEKDIKTWTILLMHYGKVKLVGKALLIFEKMRRSGFEPDSEAYRLMIQLLCQSRKGEIALEFYKEMVQKDLGVDIKLYRLLLNFLAGCGDVNGVYLVANDMIKLSHIPEHDVYCYVLKSFCVSERIREALELIRDLKNKNLMLSPIYFETLVKGLCRANRMDDALEIVYIMKKRNVVNEAVYGALINGFLRKKDTPKALDLFHGMKEAGFTPLTSTYTELMQHLFNVNEYDMGCALFNEMLERGIKLDNVAYIAMISGHVRYDHISAAWKLLESMEEQEIRPTQKSYSIFIKELCRCSRTDEIINVLKKMQNSKINIGNEIFLCVTSYLRRKKEIAKLDEVEEMQRHFGHYCQEVEASGNDSSNGEMNSGKSNYVKPNVDCLLLDPLPSAHYDENLHDVYTILSSSKDWPAIKEALEKCTIFYTPDLVTKILHICIRCGYAALHFFSWVRNQPGYKHTTDCYNMAIKIAGRGKDFEHMRNLFYEMQRNSYLVTSDTWTIMIMSYGRVGLTDIALRNFNEMKATGCKPTASTYKYLILSLCGRKGRKVNEAIKLFREMTDTGLVPDKELVEVLFDCLCQVGKLEDARKCMESLQKVGFTDPLSYSLLIRALCRRGKLEEALALANDVTEDRSTLDHYVYGSLVHGLLQKGQIDEALARIDSMKRAGVNPTVHVYTSLISHFCKEKQMEKALGILKTMWEERCHPTIVTYSALIHGYMNVGNVVEAQRLFLRMRMKGPFPDFRAYSMLIAGLSEMGKSEAALHCLSEMLEDGIVPSTVNFRTVFFGLNREGKQHLAQTVMQQKRVVANKRKFLAS